MFVSMIHSSAENILTLNFSEFLQVQQIQKLFSYIILLFSVERLLPEVKKYPRSEGTFSFISKIQMLEVQMLLLEAYIQGLFLELEVFSLWKQVFSMFKEIIIILLSLFLQYEMNAKQVQPFIVLFLLKKLMNSGNIQFLSQPFQRQLQSQNSVFEEIMYFHYLDCQPYNLFLKKPYQPKRLLYNHQFGITCVNRFWSP